MKRISAFIRRNLNWKTWWGRWRRRFIEERWVYPLVAWFKGKELVYYLHINKAAGTSVLAALDQLGMESDRCFVVPLPHNFGLHKVPFGAKVACFIRHPATRFASGFEHMLRKGYPSYQVEWSAEEAMVFQRFQRFEDLVAATLEGREEAFRAWKQVFHLRLSYSHYFQSIAYLESQRERLVFVGCLESMGEDWDRMFQRLYGQTRPMERQNALKTSRTASDAVRKAIERVYPEEFPLYEALMRVRELQVAQAT